MLRRAWVVMWVAVAACPMGTEVDSLTFVCATNDDCTSGYLCFEGTCLSREVFFARQDAGPDAGEPDGGADAGVDAGADAGLDGGEDGGVDGGDGGEADGGCDAGTGIELCGDGVDNNCDGLVDCEELACATMACGLEGQVCTGLACTCGGGGDPEASELTCGDAKDNDCDGQTDCADPTCSGRACGANGMTCAGSACECSGNGGTPEASEQTCNDGDDNDCDGLVDCADSSCNGRACGANGRTCSGSSCTCSGNGGTPQTFETICNDGDDNDCDGQTDCNDSSCNGRACGANGRTCSGTSCTCSGNGGPAQFPETACGDGFDNDCDGQVDGADSDCVTYAVSSTATVFVDACALPGMTRHTFGDADDDYTAQLTMPFPFRFFGVLEADYWVSTNSMIGFAGRSSGNDSYCLPSSSLPDPGIYVAFNDTMTTNGLCTAVTGTAPNRKLVVTWPNMDHYAFSGADMTYSAILSETTNTIDLVYSTMNGSLNALGGDAVVGVQADNATRATQYVCHVPGSLTTGLAIRFTPQ